MFVCVIFRNMIQRPQEGPKTRHLITKIFLKPLDPCAYDCLGYPCLMLTDESDTTTHCIKNLLNPLTATGAGCRNFHGHRKHRGEPCWHTDEDKDGLMAESSCQTKIVCGKQPIRTNTLPISAANKWRQESVHSTEKTTTIPLHTPHTPLQLPRPPARLDVAVPSGISVQDTAQYIKSRPKQLHKFLL
jgi:hypothetical protein